MKNKTPVALNESRVPCMEVSVSKDMIESCGYNLLWTLSVYSLDNQPAGDGPGNAMSYHFMVYDWKKTVRHILETSGIPYAIQQYFTVDTIYRNSKKKVFITRKDAEILFGINNVTPEMRFNIETTFAEPA